jgi:endonuclease-8
MPEGDTLFRIARALGRVLEGKPIVAVRAARPLGPFAPRPGATIAAVESRGKNLLVRFAGGTALHVHLGMGGSVHLYRAGEPFRRPTWQASLIVQVEAVVAVVFRASLVRALRDPDADRTLAELGPDVLRDDFDKDDACRRLRSLPPDTPLGDALLDQRALAGIGNVYKCEALFECRLDPFAPIASIDDARLRELVERARGSMQRNLANGPRVTREPGRGRAMPGARRRGSAHSVYGRAGRPCFICASLIRAKRAGHRGRITWYCPTCQGMAGSDASERTQRPASATSASSRTCSASSRASASAESATARSSSRSRSRSAS